MPDSVEMPAPVKATMFPASVILRLRSSPFAMDPPRPPCCNVAVIAARRSQIRPAEASLGDARRDRLEDTHARQIEQAGGQPAGRQNRDTAAVRRAVEP